mmetsp:Transcript_12083/g.23016  ORF Transcript_12083/g.23016 Transcript_12083/m.23016 type:complete len:202 (+) Transcript_12083:225-830(+)
MESKKRPFSAFLTKRRDSVDPICAITSPFKVDLASPHDLLRIRPARDFMHLIRPYKRIIGSSTLLRKREEYCAVYPVADLPKKQSRKYLSNVSKIVSIDELQKLDIENATLRSELLRTSSEACMALDRLQSPRAASKSRLMLRTKTSLENSYAHMQRPMTTQTGMQRSRVMLNTRSSMRSFRTAPQPQRIYSSQSTQRSLF